MKQKKIPIRTCVVSKEKYPKKELIRVVKDNLGNVFVDETGKQNGKGAYLKKDLDIILKAKQTKILEKYLQCSINEEIYDKLNEIINKK